MSAGSRGRRVRRTAAVATVAVVAAAGALAVGYAVTAKPRAEGTSVTVPTGSAAVTRGTVSQRIRIPGTYGFDGAYSVVHQGPPGILTTIAEPGTGVRRGGVLYAVDARPARLLFGGVPAYREFRAGMSAGADVRQLERNLVALGMDPQRRMTVDDRFTPATAAAIRRWEASWGVPAAARTGALPLGRVVFLPAALRVGAAPVAVGTAVGPNEPVLSATSQVRVVTAQVSADRQESLDVGDAVTVSLPGAVEVPGRVLRTGLVATVPEPDGGGGGDGRPVGQATVTVVVGVSVPDGTPDFDQAPVLVSIATSVRKNVLQVPVAALLARPEGGYRVRLTSGTYVTVDPGIFDEVTGKVEVAGRLTAGDRVEVPVS
ncbi:MAG TPA: peptidoglycan-binding protein [Asanoa sp.]